MVCFVCGVLCVCVCGCGVLCACVCVCVVTYLTARNVDDSKIKHTPSVTDSCFYSPFRVVYFYCVTVILH